MSRQRLSDVLARFLDSRAPVLFIIGSLALALLGNALYALVLLMFGEQPVTLVGIVIGAALIVPFIAWGVRSVSAAIAQRARMRLEVPLAERIAPHPGLVLAVGLRPNGPERAILEWHMQQATLRHCWLIVSQDVQQSAKLKDLRQWLLECNVEHQPLAVTDPWSLSDSYHAATEALQRARVMLRALPVAVDITGGTSVMSAGLALAAREQGAALQYYPARYDAGGHVIPDSATAPLLVAFVAGGKEMP